MNEHYVRTGQYVLGEDANHLYGWRSTETFKVDGIVYRPWEASPHTGAMFSFKGADGSEGWDGERHKSTEDNLTYNKLAFDEYADIEWNPDLRL